MEATTNYNQKNDRIVIHELPEKEIMKWIKITKGSVRHLSSSTCLIFNIGEVEFKLFT